jgi:hypothetical protein
MRKGDLMAQNHVNPYRPGYFCCLNCCLQESIKLPQIAIKQVTDTFIFKGINDASIGMSMSVM